MAAEKAGGLDKAQVINAFNKAAASYDQVAVLQREIGTRLLERLQYIQFTPTSIVDVGGGTGQCSQALSQRFQHSQIICLDIAEAMLMQAQKKTADNSSIILVCADAERLALADNSVDFIFSNLTLQWVNDLGRCFAEFQRILRPGGLLLFSTFGPDTLKELRQSWANVDSAEHVHTFIDMHHFGDALLAAGYIDPVMDMEMMTMTYKNMQALMLDLKKLGAHNASAGRHRSMLGKDKLRLAKTAYEQFRKDGLLPASYEVIYGHAWGATIGEQGEVMIPVDQLKIFPR